MKKYIYCIIIISCTLLFTSCRGYSALWGYPVEPKVSVEKSNFTGEFKVSTSWTYVTFTDNKQKTRLYRFVYDSSDGSIVLYLDWNSYNNYCVDETSTLDFYMKSGNLHTLYCINEQCASPLTEYVSNEYGEDRIETNGYNIFMTYWGDFSFLDSQDYIQEVRIKSRNGIYYEDKIKGAQVNTMNKAYKMLLNAIDEN